MKIEKIDINLLKEYENNAKIHTQEQIEQICNSIKKFGNNDPIAVDENNVIIEGHGRLYALKQLGYEDVEVIRLSHLNEQQKKAYILAHNKLTMNTGFDFERLENELKDISLDMADFGFDLDSVNMIDLLEEDGFSSLSDTVANSVDTFSVTFQFPTEKKLEITEFIKSKTKNYFVADILNKMEEEKQ